MCPLFNWCEHLVVNIEQRPTECKSSPTCTELITKELFLVTHLYEKSGRNHDKIILSQILMLSDNASTWFHTTWGTFSRNNPCHRIALWQSVIRLGASDYNQDCVTERTLGQLCGANSSSLSNLFFSAHVKKCINRCITCICVSSSDGAQMHSYRTHISLIMAVEVTVFGPFVGTSAL